MLTFVVTVLLSYVVLAMLADKFGGTIHSRKQNSNIPTNKNEKEPESSDNKFDSEMTKKW